MKISVITPTYNSEKSIEQNVQSLLVQNYTNFEQIIIDNLSDDKTLAKIKKLYKSADNLDKLRILTEKDSGISEAFNKGIELAEGEVIGILNSDDYFYDEDVLQKVAHVFNDENILFVHGNIFFEDPRYGSNIRRPLLCHITRAMPYNHPTMFFRRKVYEGYGLFDSGYSYAMDFEFICRLVKRVDDFYRKGIYLNGAPLVTMAAGGVSWKNELASLKESRRALKEYEFWNFDAKKNHMVRVVRTKFKYWLSVIKMESVVMIWRRRKWGN